MLFVETSFEIMIQNQLVRLRLGILRFRPLATETQVVSDAVLINNRHYSPLRKHSLGPHFFLVNLRPRLCIVSRVIVEIAKQE
jgi:hypothetical protein